MLVVNDRKSLLLSLARIIIGAAFLPQLFQFSLGAITITPYRIAVILALLVCMLCKNSKLRLDQGTSTEVLRLSVTWIAIALISLLWCVSFIDGLKTTLYVIFAFVGIAILLSAHTSTRDLINTIRVLMVIIFVHLLIGAYEAYSGRYFFSIGDWRVSWYVRQRYPISMFYNTNNFGLLCFYTFCLSLAMLLVSSGSLKKLFYLFVIVLSIVLLSLTRSRAVLLALLLGVIVFIFCYYKANNRSSRAIWLGLITFAIIGVLIFRNEIVLSTLESAGNLVKEMESDVRLNLIKNGLRFLYETFGFGIGVGSSEYWLSTKAVYDIGTVYIWHNLWLEIMVEYGLIVFMLYFVTYVKNIKSYIEKIRQNDTSDKRQVVLSIAMLSISIGLVIGALGPSSLINAQWSWMIFGLLLCTRKVNEEGKDETSRDTHEVL